jgi:glutathione S-transferase
MATPQLVHIPFSPWSRRVSLALTHAGIDVRLRPYTPTLSEPWLRARLRRLRGPVTVPVLLRDDGPPLTDGWDILCWAQQQGAELWSDDAQAQVKQWHERASHALQAGRLRTTHAVLADRDALTASLPPPIARLGAVGRAIGRDASRRLLRKYGPLGGDSPEAWSEALSSYADQLWQAVSDAGGDHLLGVPSYADLAAAVGLSFVLPDPAAPISRRARGAWIHDEVASRHAELLAWRDRVMRAWGAVPRSPEERR